MERCLSRPADGGMYRKSMIYSVYILYSDTSNTYYIGFTANLADRLGRHNKGRSKSTKFGVPWRLVYREECNTRAEAVQREK